jgi:hypothetical protein
VWSRTYPRCDGRENLEMIWSAAEAGERREVSEARCNEWYRAGGCALWNQERARGGEEAGGGGKKERSILKSEIVRLAFY